jgi:murein DD-endopeptidase MepM/ murein hydrolase activator NlpD
MVAAQQPIARVRNSGNSLEPHLHIEARRNGAKLGLEFQGRTFSVNSLLTGGNK